MKGNPLISGKSRLVKYDSLWPAIHWRFFFRIPRSIFEDLFVHRDALLQQFQDVELTAGTVVEFDVERDHHKKSALVGIGPEGPMGVVCWTHGPTCRFFWCIKIKCLNQKSLAKECGWSKTCFFVPMVCFPTLVYHERSTSLVYSVWVLATLGMISHKLERSKQTEQHGIFTWIGSYISMVNWYMLVDLLYITWSMMDS